MKPLKQSASLAKLAERYVWWETTKWAYNHPEIFLANVMNLAPWDDMQLICILVGDQILQEALRNAPPGYYSQRSWDYWHHRLKLTPIPPLPKRRFE